MIVKTVDSVFKQLPLESPDIIFVDERFMMFACPCKCGRETFLHRDDAPIKKKGQPTWSIDIVNATISPSIRELVGCKSHYFIKNGKVDFCKDTGR